MNIQLKALLVATLAPQSLSFSQQADRFAAIALRTGSLSIKVKRWGSEP